MRTIYKIDFSIKILFMRAFSVLSNININYVIYSIYEIYECRKHK